MYCPKCGADFVEGVTVCSDCGIELTPEPPTEPEATYVEWVTVFGDRQESRVRLAESIVRGADIDCVVEGDETQLAGVADPVRLCVRPEDVDRATELLKELLEGEA
jgi:hypothetical protein